MNLSIKQNHRHKEQTCSCQWGGGWGRDGLDLQVSRCKPLYADWIKNMVLLCNPGNYIQYPVINYNGKEYEKEYIYI